MIVKIASVQYSNDVMWTVNYLNDIYKVNVATKDAKRLAYLNQFSNYMEICFKTGMILYSLSTLAFFINPIYMYVFEHKVVTLAPEYVPGIKESTFDGFIILSCYHLVIVVLALVAASASDFLFTMLVISTPVLAVLVKMEVGHLNEALRQGTSDADNVANIKFKFRNILLMHRDMTE